MTACAVSEDSMTEPRYKKTVSSIYKSIQHTMHPTARQSTYTFTTYSDSLIEENLNNRACQVALDVQECAKTAKILQEVNDPTFYCLTYHLSFPIHLPK